MEEGVGQYPRAVACQRCSAGGEEEQSPLAMACWAAVEGAGL